MATETFLKQYTAGVTVYFVIRDAAGNYFDMDDNTFKALASCVDPYIEATERILKSGADDSNYVATFDLGDLAPGLAVVECFVMAIKRVGGSPDLAADLAISQPEPLIAQLEKLGRRVMDVKWAIGTKTTAGTTVQVWAELTADGEPVALHTIDSGATCALEVKQHGNTSQFSMTTGDIGAVNAAHRFEAEYTNPNFTADRVYAAKITVVADGQTYVRDRTFTVVP